MISVRHSISALLLGAITATPAWAVTAQTDDFQDGTTQGWSSTYADPTPPVNEANVGPTGPGDHSLFIEAEEFESIAIQNSTQWTGSFTGIDEILFDYQNIGTTGFTLGATISGPGGTVITLSTASVPAASGWATGSINITPGNLASLGGSISATLANVTLIELDHISGGSNLIAATPIEVRFDNIRVIPEPSAAVLLLVAGLGLMYRRASR